MTATLKKIWSTATITALVAAGAGFALTAQAASAQEVNDRRVSRLGELIVVNELFDGHNGAGNGVMGNKSNLGELIVVDGLFAPMAGEAGATGSSRVSRLGELITLTGLFDHDVDEGAVVVVEAGDTLRGIAAQFLGNANRAGEIAALNGIANPNLIFPGQRLVLPATAVNGNGVSGTSDLGELIVLDGLFAPVHGDSAAAGTSRVSRLGELIVLSELFNGNGMKGIGHDSDLGELIVLESLFTPVGLF